MIKEITQMKLGITLTVVGSIMLLGNLIYLEVNPIWALLIRLAISGVLFWWGIVRINRHRKVKQQNE